MKRAPTFDQVLEEADSLSPAEKSELVDILRSRLVEANRQEIAKDIKDARAEYRRGQCKVASSQELVREILA